MTPEVPATPTGASGDGGVPIGVVLGLLVLVALVGAGGLALGARMGRRSKG